MVVTHIKNTLINAGERQLFTAVITREELEKFVKDFPNTQIFIHADCKSKDKIELIANVYGETDIYIVADLKDSMLIKIAYPDT
jgi:hypothetical protein